MDFVAAVADADEAHADAIIGAENAGIAQGRDAGKIPSRHFVLRVSEFLPRRGAERPQARRHDFTLPSGQLRPQPRGGIRPSGQQIPQLAFVIGQVVQFFRTLVDD
jgi:hypothetical protein